VVFVSLATQGAWASVGIAKLVSIRRDWEIQILLLDDNRVFDASCDGGVRAHGNELGAFPIGLLQPFVKRLPLTLTART
jgi:hypothetical protein